MVCFINTQLITQDISTDYIQRRMRENERRRRQASFDLDPELSQYLEDERLALILQNSEFLQELRDDETFMKTLERGQWRDCWKTLCCDALSLCTSVQCVCVCACVIERERKRWGECVCGGEGGVGCGWWRERERIRKRKRESVCVYMSVSECILAGLRLKCSWRLREICAILLCVTLFLCSVIMFTCLLYGAHGHGNKLFIPVLFVLLTKVMHSS